LNKRVGIYLKVNSLFDICVLPRLAGALANKGKYVWCYGKGSGI
jgi:hypothetical protein